MKRITYSGGSIITSDASAIALLDYISSVADADNNVTVDVTALEEHNETSVHTLVFNSTTEFDINDVDGMTVEEETARFPLPELPIIGIVGIVETTGDASRTADDFNSIAAEIDNGLGQ
jgi:ribonuclease PH